MTATADLWLLPRRALAEPYGADWPAWSEKLASLARPFALAEQELSGALRFGSALGWLDLARQPQAIRQTVAQGLEGAAAVAARLRLHHTVDWLAERRQALGSWPDGTVRVATWRALARLDVGLLPATAADRDAVAHALRPLADLRRYGPAEEYIVAAVGQAIADYPSVPDETLAGWLLGQLNLAAAWVGLTRGKGDAFRKLVQRSPVVEDDWPGWLIAGRRDDGVARYRAYLAGEAAWRAERAGIAGQEPEAVAWLRAQAQGWVLAADGNLAAEAVRAVAPGILTGG